MYTIHVIGNSLPTPCSNVHAYVYMYIYSLAKYFACCRNIFGIYLLLISTVKAHGLAFILYRVGTKLILYMLITHALMACTLIKI